MAKRLTDIILSLLALVILSPFLLIIGVGIYLSDGLPIFFKAKRVGYKGKEFTLYKFRTMYKNQRNKHPITAKDDPRIFGFGKILRNLKLDELPQLLNILKGEMSIIGPRAEDPEIVEKFFLKEYFESFNVKPGLSSPGALFNYTHGESLLDVDNVEEVYSKILLPLKTALEIVYVRNYSYLYDLKLIFRTIKIIVMKLMGKKNFSCPPEMEEAIEILSSWKVNSNFVYSICKSKDNRLQLQDG